MSQIGLFSLLGYRKKIERSFSDVIHWRYASGREVEGEKYETILGSYDGRVAEPLLDSLYRGLSEAMTNCHHHAYINVREDGLNSKPTERTWWMFSQEKDGVLSVAFCDLGVGIPATLPQKQPSIWRTIVSLGQAGSDSEIIAKAVESSLSRTGKAYRGKGLRQLLEAVQAARSPDAMMMIFSNRGRYLYQNGATDLRDYADSILGTLILWRLPVVQRSLV